MMPTDPGKNAIGTNTAISTSVMPMMALVICVIALRVASFGGRRSSGKIAFVGQAGSQAPQSMHSSGSITRKFGPS